MPGSRPQESRQNRAVSTDFKAIDHAQMLSPLYGSGLNLKFTELLGEYFAKSLPRGSSALDVGDTISDQAKKIFMLRYLCEKDGLEPKAEDLAKLLEYSELIGFAIPHGELAFHNLVSPAHNDQLLAKAYENYFTNTRKEHPAGFPANLEQLKEYEKAFLIVDLVARASQPESIELDPQSACDIFRFQNPKLFTETIAKIKELGLV
ncbi:MAG: hypothetical protein R3A13_07860 [Bdellovibrionota bacterium]